MRGTGASLRLGAGRNGSAPFFCGWGGGLDGCPYIKQQRLAAGGKMEASGGAVGGGR